MYTNTHQSTQEKQILVHTNILLHKNIILLLLYMENLDETKNPTIYSVVSTHYKIENLSNQF